MRIIHVEDRFHPGMGYQINFMARFHNPEHEFFIVTSDSTSIWNNLSKEKLKQLDQEFENNYDVKIIRLPSRLSEGQKSNIWIRKLIPTIKKLHPDIIFAHCIENYSSIRIFLRFSAKKIRLATDTHTLKNQFKGGIKEKIYFSLHKYFIIRKINKYGLKTFFTATENKHILHEQYGIEKKNIFPCPIGTDASLFYFDKTSKETLRTKHQIANDEVILLYTGKLNHRKQPHHILSAVKIIEDKITIPLVLFFVGPKENNYYNEYFKYNFSNPKIKVIEVPAVANEDLYQYYSMADFVVFPRENTLSALDAQLCKIPVVMQNDLTNSERLKEGGLLFENENEADLAEKILNLYTDKSLREELGEKGFNFIRENYNYQKIIQNAERILTEDLK